MSGNIVLLGATGYAGRLTLEAMLRREIRPLLAGHDEVAVRALADEYGLLSAHADVNDPTSLSVLVDEGDVLVSTVGPYYRLGKPVVEAALRQGAHYVDCSGEPDFVRDLVDSFDGRAREAGVTMIPSCGNTYSAGILAAEIACERADGFTHAVDIGYFVLGPVADMRIVSRGTRKTFIETVERPALSYVDGEIVTSRILSKAHHFDVDGRRVAASLSGGAEVAHLPRLRPDVAEIHVYNGWFRRVATPVRIATETAKVLRKLPGGKKVVDSLTESIVGEAAGPDADMRSDLQTCVVANVSDADGNLVSSVELLGGNPYELTGEMLAWAASELAAGRGRAAGVIDPVRAFGVDAFQSACDQMGFVEV